MALSVLKRPLGFFVAQASTAGTITFGSSTITSNGHGMSTGDYVYVGPNEATGFWYVTSLGANTFNIREYAGATVYSFVGSGSFSFFKCETSTHSWNAVHLPIVYKLSSTLWPTNSVDTVRTVSSIANDNGFVKLTLSGALKSSVTELDWVKVTNQNAGIYQILTVYSTSIVTINFPYVTGLTFAASSVQFYYNNYNARIRVYAGIISTNTFVSQKPHELISETKVTPDSSGIVSIIINEDVKKKIEIFKNDIVSPTLPMNIDAFCNFYISYAESYDTSDGYTPQTTVGTYTDEVSTFQGFALNASLPFQNIHSGSMSEYVMFNGATASFNPPQGKFLTPSSAPRICSGQYFDVSFLATSFSTLTFSKRYFKEGVVQSQVDTPVTDFDDGVYRMTVPTISDEDRIDVFLSGDYQSQTLTITVGCDCSPTYLDLTWLNYLGGFDYWRFNASSDYGVDIINTTQSTKNIIPQWPKSYGEGADTIKGETSRQSVQTILLRAENLTEDQVNDLWRIRTSSLVQLINSTGTVKTTVIPEAESFVYLPEGEKLFTLSFTVTLTSLLPNQSQ